MKVWLFGDSICQGVVYDEARLRYRLTPESFAARIAQLLDGDFINCSVMGATLARGEQLIARKPIAKGDIVLIGYGGNDCDYNWKEISQTPDEEHLCNIPPQAFSARYAALIERVRAMGAKPVALTLPPLLPEKYFAFLSKGLCAENILRWLGDVGQIYRWQELYSHTISRLSATLGCALIDVRDAFLSVRNLPSLICIDGIHPNESGQRLISGTVCAGGVF